VGQEESLAALSYAIPELQAIGVPKSELSHEAAVGPIAEHAAATLVLGFIKIELPGLSAVLKQQLDCVLAATVGRSL
jgi:hypothetical protein